MDSASRALRDDLSHDPAKGPAIVRLSVIQTFVTGFLFRHLPAFPDRHPNIQLELICENRESVLEPTTPRASAVPPAGKPRPRPDPDPGLEPQPQA